MFLRSIADMPPHSGKIMLDGDASGMMSGPEWRKKVGMLPSESSWWFDTVGEHFNKVHEIWFKALGFTPGVLKWHTNRLSSGERQRLALLRLLSNHPEALLLDEPTTNLDLENMKRVEKLLENYRLEEKASVFWVCHDMDQIKRVSNRCFHLKDNQFIEF